MWHMFIRQGSSYHYVFFCFFLLVQLTFNLLPNKRVKPIQFSKKAKKKTIQSRRVQNWPLVFKCWYTVAYCHLTLRWLCRKSLTLKNLNYMRVRTSFIQKLTAQLLYCPKKTVILSCFCGFFVNCRTLPLEFSTTAHTSIISCFSTLMKSFVFFLKQQEIRSVIRIKIHMSIYKKENKYSKTNVVFF